jgi:hypothetical protein
MLKDVLRLTYILENYDKIKETMAQKLMEKEAK